MLNTLWQGTKAFFRPTLVRRLVATQMLMLMVLWSLLIGYAVLESNKTQGIINNKRIFEVIAVVAHNLADKPQQREETLRVIEQTLRFEFGSDNNADMAPSIQIKENDQLIFQSHDYPQSVQATRQDEIEAIHANGRNWKVRQIKSNDIAVAIVHPDDKWSFFISLNSRGYYLLPLIISLPFLILPSWLSVAFGLRPWSKVVQEVAQRGPNNMTALSFRPAHKELAAMVDSINQLLHRVAESTLRERSFIADAAHELRTPLAALAVNVEALQKQGLDERAQALLKGILSGANRASRLISQLLMLTRNDSRATGQPQKIFLDTLLQERLASLSVLANRRNIELELELVSDSNIEVLGLQESLESMLDNLIENAIKYSPEHGTVAVHLSADAQQAYLTISDQGPGIPPHLHERVFDRFFRVTDQTQSGSGLGLSIVKSAVTQHGGIITIHSHDNGSGTRMHVTLPLARKSLN